MENAMALKNRKTILLVDDDSYFRSAMATELRALGYLVVCARTVREPSR